MKTNKNDPVLEKNEVMNVNGITNTTNPKKILNNDFSFSMEKIITKEIVLLLYRNIIWRAIIEAITEPTKTS